MTIRQHIPNYVAGVDPLVHSFATVDELLAIRWVRAFRLDPAFHRFSLAGYGERMLLMAEVDDGFAWFVVGAIDSALGLVALPRWSPRRRPFAAPGSPASRLPLNCFACGAALRGEATEHIEGCSVLALIRKEYGANAVRVAGAGADGQ